MIIDLKLVIECHGEQHYREVCFGGIDLEEASDKLLDQRRRDSNKAQAAIDAGWTYIVIPHWDYKKVDEQYVLDLYREHLNNIIVEQDPREPSEYQQTQLQRAKEHRRQQYIRWKDLQKTRRDNNGS